MVDAQPGHLVGGDQRPNQAVRRREDRGILHAQAHQVVHIEEAAVVDFFGGRAPGGQPVGLRVEQHVQAVEAVGIPFDAIDVFARILITGCSSRERSASRNLRQQLLQHGPPLLP